MAKQYKLKIMVDEHENVWNRFGTTNARIRIYRSTTGLEQDRVLFHTLAMHDPTTDPPGSPLHEYIDPDGQDNYVVWYTYYNNSNADETAFSDEAKIKYGTSDFWYINLEDIRNENISTTMLSDERAVQLIRQAQSFIDTITGRHFLPEDKILKVDSDYMHMLVIPEPIIKIDSVDLEELTGSGSAPTLTNYDVTTMRVYNRHLTQRLISPDDRERPHIMITPEFFPRYDWTGIFLKARQQYRIEGVFGYTELLPSDAAGETEPGSQIPINYGRCPPMIQDAMLRLVVRWMTPLGNIEFRKMYELAGKVRKWQTDKQSIEYQRVDEIGIPYITGDPDIDETLINYAKGSYPQVSVI